jgi:glycosyltransferase involved in cell wall biosynthesis
VSEPDRGQSHAINKGFQRCSGDIITFLSSDDIYLPGTFENLQSLWPKIKVYGAVVGGFRFMDENSTIQERMILPHLGEPAPLDLTLGPPGVYRLHQVSTFYIREALDQVGRYVQENLHYVMDRELLYRVCRRFPIHLVNQPYGAFRRHSHSKSSATILPFAREFARIYYDSLTGNPIDDRQRIKMARYRISRGYIKYALSVSDSRKAVTALVRAAVYTPGLIRQLNYYHYWKKILLKDKSRITSPV